MKAVEQYFAEVPFYYILFYPVHDGGLKCDHSNDTEILMKAAKQVSVVLYSCSVICSIHSLPSWSILKCEHLNELTYKHNCQADTT